LSSTSRHCHQCQDVAIDDKDIDINDNVLNSKDVDIINVTIFDEAIQNVNVFSTHCHQFQDIDIDDKKHRL